MLNRRRFDEASALHRSGRLEEAAEKYAALLALNPGDPGLLHSAGLLAGQRGNYPEAMRLLRRAAERAPRVEEYRASLAAMVERESAAVSAAEVYNQQGNSLLGARRYAEALAAYDRALELQPGSAHFRCNRGVALAKLGRHDEAAALLYAIRDDGKLSYVPLNLGNALVGLGHIDEALAAYGRALAIEPDLAEAHWARGQALLLLGRFAEGWAEYEWRRRWQGAENPYAASLPAWRGEDAKTLGGKLLVVSEQGFGDAIQFARYLPLLVEAEHSVVFEVRDELYGLFAEGLSREGIEIVTRGAAQASDPLTAASCKAQVPLLSLPFLLETRAETVPRNIPYLRPPDRTQVAVRQAGPRIGLVRSGQPRHANDSSRSLPAGLLAPVLDREAEFFSLQIAPFAAPNVIELGVGFRNFAETAAALATMDLIISVDTSVAHLAGAMGKPLWLLLPYTPDWRWGLTGDQTPWYPTARLFRQGTRGGWNGVVARVAGALDEFLFAYRAGHHG